MTPSTGKQITIITIMAIYDVIEWETNNYNKHIAQYLNGNQTIKFGQLMEYSENIFLEKLCRK